MQDDRELDRMIDRMIEAALAGYSRVEPMPSLEQRILARARTEQPQSHRHWWPWLLAIPAAACLLLFSFLPAPKETSRKGAYTASTSVPPATSSASRLVAAPPLSVPQPTVARSRPKIGQSAAESSLPKQNVFPSPSPLTAEEHALIALSRVSTPLPKQPESAAVNIEPIHIAELDIEPVVVPALDPSKSYQPPTNDKQP